MQCLEGGMTCERRGLSLSGSGGSGRARGSVRERGRADQASTARRPCGVARATRVLLRARRPSAVQCSPSRAVYGSSHSQPALRPTPTTASDEGREPSPVSILRHVDEVRRQRSWLPAVSGCIRQASRLGPNAPATPGRCWVTASLRGPGGGGPSGTSSLLPVGIRD
ncbi:hypothetical protein OH77DRAFT_1179396 [Trametes cingulata]|nr:hypothetical protein OH77DRAFT_1179396 [Trametes cingulata]